MAPIFSVVTTAKNEKNLDKTFDNWDYTRQLFEDHIKRRNAVEFIFVDAGGNNGLVERAEGYGFKIVYEDEYEEYRGTLYETGETKYKKWNTPSMGRNLGFKYAEGKIDIFQDSDTYFSTGTVIDYQYINSAVDSYKNYLEVMYDAFRKKNIVAAAPSMRPSDSKSLHRRFGIKGQNFMTFSTCKLPTIEFLGNPVIGASAPGPSFVVLNDVVSRIDGPYNPRLAIGEDYLFSRNVGKFGRVSYEKKACAFIRTFNRVKNDRLEFIRSLLLALKWSPHYVFPGFVEYKRHDLSA